MITTLLFHYSLAAILIMFGGVLLVRSGELIAGHFGIGRVWLGSILIAAATSFPELVTSVKAVLNHTYDMSLANIYGSILFNLAILAVAVLCFSKWKKEEIRNTIKVATFFSVFLIGVTLLFLYIQSSFTFLYMGIGSWIILISYVFYIKITFVREKESSVKETLQYTDLKKNIILYLIAVILIFVAGIYCIHIAEELVRITGWDEGFVGILFLALATSLPEIVTVFQAARMQSLNLILGIVWGSNIFNLCVISVSDIFAGPLSLLSQMSLGNLFTGLITIFFALFVPFIFSLALNKHFLSLKTAGFLVIVSYISILLMIFFQSL